MEWGHFPFFLYIPAAWTSHVGVAHGDVTLNVGIFVLRNSPASSSGQEVLACPEDKQGN